MDVLLYWSNIVAFSSMAISLIILFSSYRDKNSKNKLKAYYLIGIAIVVIINNNPAMMPYMSFWATIFLAVAAFVSITAQSRAANKERTERYLSEIVSWLSSLELKIFKTGVSKGFKGELIEEVNQRLDLNIDLEIWHSLEKYEECTIRQEELRDVLTNGEYLQKLGNTIDNELGISIENLIKLLETRLELYSKRKNIKDLPDAILEEDLTLVGELIRAPQLPIPETMNDWNKNSVVLGRNADTIRKSVKVAIDKTVKIKAGLLSS